MSETHSETRSETRSDALTELVRSLREQLSRREERIANLEALLQEANRRVTDQQKLLTQLLDERAKDWSARPAESPSLVVGPTASSSAVSLPVRTPSAASTVPARSVPPTPQPAPSSERPERVDQRINERNNERIKLPDLGPQIQIIATAVVSAAARKKEEIESSVEIAEDDFEITARLDRDKLRRGHRALDARKRRFWPWSKDSER